MELSGIIHAPDSKVPVTPSTRSTYMSNIHYCRIFGTFLFGLLSACTTLDSGYRTVNLPAQFEKTAQRIVVTAPIRRYNDSFFNIELGAHRAQDVSIDKKKRISAATDNKTPVSSITVDNTSWNLLVNQSLVVEKVDYEQYRSEHEWNYSFSIIDENGGKVLTKCTVNDLGLDNKETGRTEVGLDIGRKTSGTVTYYGEWLASRIICRTTDDEAEWQLQLTLQQNTKPELQLTGTSWLATTMPLNESMADSPELGGQSGSKATTTPTGDYLPGFRIASGNTNVAAVSLLRGNNVVWLAPDLSSGDNTRMVALSYSVILYKWLIGA